MSPTTATENLKCVMLAEGSNDHAVHILIPASRHRDRHTHRETQEHRQRAGDHATELLAAPSSKPTVARLLEQLLGGSGIFGPAAAALEHQREVEASSVLAGAACLVVGHPCFVEVLRSTDAVFKRDAVIEAFRVGEFAAPGKQRGGTPWVPVHADAAVQLCTERIAGRRLAQLARLAKAQPPWAGRPSCQGRPDTARRRSGTRGPRCHRTTSPARAARGEVLDDQRAFDQYGAEVRTWYRSTEIATALVQRHRVRSAQGQRPCRIRPDFPARMRGDTQRAPPWCRRRSPPAHRTRSRGPSRRTAREARPASAADPPAAPVPAGRPPPRTRTAPVARHRTRQIRAPTEIRRAR